MIKYIAKRLLWMIPILLGVLLIVFTISYFTPGDPVVSLLGDNYTDEMYAQKVEELGLDKPFFVQYIDYIVGIVTRFDFGISYTYKHKVGQEIASRIMTTLKLGWLGIAVGVVIGVPSGILSATKQYSAADYTITVIAMFFAAVPNFWLGLMLMLLFSLKLSWFPAAGIDTWRGWVLPVITQGLGGVAINTRMSRTSMLEVIRQDYIRTARAKGLSEKVVIWKHALKNAMIPVVTVIGSALGMCVGGSVIVETIFSIPGLGLYMMSGINNRDYPVINGTVLVMSLCICLANLLVDVLYAYIDPRIKAQYTVGKSKRKLRKLMEKAREEEAAES